jgi:hypothetical protein
VKKNLQPELHPDANKLSVFVEGAATARERDWMLAHLAECVECRKAVFLMQPHEEPQLVTATPVKGWVWRRLVPIGLPAAAIACGLIAVFIYIYIRPHEAAPSNQQQIASVRESGIEHPRTTTAPTTNSEPVAQSGGSQSSFAPGAAAADVSRRKNLVAGSNLTPRKKSAQAAANIASPQITGAAPSLSVANADAATPRESNSSVIASELPLNGRVVTNDEPLSKQADTKGAAAQNSLANKKDLPALQVQRASVQADMLSGVSGRITDRTGAIISGATVTLRDVAGKTLETATGADGSFHMTNLPAGRYELMAAASGFKPSRQSIELKPSEFAMLQPMLDVGAASEQVTVEAGSTALQVQTESAEVGQTIAGRVVTQMPIADRSVAAPPGLPVSHGKRFLSLDSVGNLFLSRNDGKKWKKIKPQWVGKAVRIELTPAYSGETPPKAKKETSVPSREGAVFQLTTETGSVWTSKDGAHWHQQ